MEGEGETPPHRVHPLRRHVDQPLSRRDPAPGKQCSESVFNGLSDPDSLIAYKCVHYDENLKYRFEYLKQKSKKTCPLHKASKDKNWTFSRQLYALV